ncbi:MAG: hypothetical protein AAGF92_17720 [Myxococcota bacterium]
MSDDQFAMEDYLAVTSMAAESLMRPSAVAYVLVRMGVPAKAITKDLEPLAQKVIELDWRGGSGARAALIALRAAETPVEVSDAVAALEAAGQTEGCEPSPSAAAIVSELFATCDELVSDKGESEAAQ